MNKLELLSPDLSSQFALFYLMVFVKVLPFVLQYGFIGNNNKASFFWRLTSPLKIVTPFSMCQQ